ncbi:MAG TPA: DUF1329 domain-containing protein [Candidatus Binataceae bacterium]|nr:DUF1329 domain-containing protein [Candidatus Binataceae bacterium]
MARLWGTILRSVVAAMVFALAVSARPAFAQVKPGDFINWENAAKVKDLIPPGAYMRVQHGMTIKVEGTELLDWPAPYKDATEKYSAQVRLTPDGRSMIGYVAGQPFPIIDDNDPKAAQKIMWDEVFKPLASDDYDLRWFECDSEYWGVNKPYFPLSVTDIGHYAGYNEVGRTEVEPFPIDPDFLTSGIQRSDLLYPVLAPAKSRGTGIMRHRYADPKRQDEIYNYDGSTRRLRHLAYSMADNTSGMGGYDPNHYGGWAGKPENYDLKYLGEKSMLASVDIHSGVAGRCPTDGGASHCPEPWQMRRIWIIEAKPRYNNLFSRELVYIDTETGWPMFVDMYDRKGELYKNWTSWLNYSDRARAESKIAIYPFKRVFVVGSSSIDVTGSASVCYHPSAEAPTPECWFINMGAIDRTWFDPTAMERAAMGGHATSGD